MTEFKGEMSEFVDFTVKNVATKQDLQDLSDRFEKVFATKEDVRVIVEKSENRILDKMDQVLQSNDHIAKKLDRHETERLALGHHVDRLKLNLS